MPTRREAIYTLSSERRTGTSLYALGTSWFLAQLKPNSAGIAGKNLNRQGFRTFLPLEEETRTRGGKFVTFSRPLFRGYIFVAFDVAGGAWRAVNSTQGVTRLVSFGKEPAAVPQELVSLLMLRCDASGKLLSRQLLQRGDQAIVTTGPFANFVAEVERIAFDRRVWVMLEIMGGQTRVAVGADQLRLSASKAPPPWVHPTARTE